MRKFSAFICTLLLLLGACISPLHAADAKTDAEALFESITEAQMRLHGVNSAEELAASYAGSAGTGAEWFIFALAQSGTLERTAFDPYSSALVGYLESNRVSAVSSRLKMALCLAATGSTDGYISYALSCVRSDSGIMAHIFALHLVTAGYTCPEFDADGLVDLILRAKGADGWSVRPSFTEVDTTAMAIQALAPYVRTRDDVAAAVGAALDYLSSAQLESGVYSYYGTENPESAAQVAVALCSLGLDPLSDTRFIKNGSTLLDGICGFVSDGSVSHEKGGAYSAVATAQAAYACLAVMRQRDGEAPLYSLDLARPDGVQADGDRYADVTGTGDNATEDSDATGKGAGDETVTAIRAIASGAILLTLGAYLVYLVRGKRLRLKRVLPLCVIAAILAAVIWTVDLKTPDGYYSDPGNKGTPVGTVTVSISVDPSLELDSERERVILDTTEVEIFEGDTVYTVLIEVCRRNRIQIENDGVSGSAYISGIDDLYEFDASPLSGWLYYVNGKTHRMPCDGYELSDGDAVEWIYGEGLTDSES